MSKKTRADLKVVLVGASGRMGQEIRNLSAQAGVKIAATVDAPKDWQSVDAAQADVVIDFSSSEGLGGAIEWCVKHNVALVSGSTGLDAKVQAGLRAAGKKIPVLYSANMSQGIAVMNAMLENLKALGDWDFQIDEAHHSQKKDKPSGTALLLQDKLTQVLGRDLPTPLSVRGGGVPGIHTVWAMGPEETLTIQHTAFNRQVFARGALVAGRWLFDKAKPGLYDLSDLYRK